MSIIASAIAGRASPVDWRPPANMKSKDGLRNHPRNG
jgi:hypothetical protein